MPNRIDRPVVGQEVRTLRALLVNGLIGWIVAALVLCAALAVAAVVVSVRDGGEEDLDTRTAAARLDGFVDGAGVLGVLGVDDTSAVDTCPIGSVADILTDTAEREHLVEVGTRVTEIRMVGHFVPIVDCSASATIDGSASVLTASMAYNPTRTLLELEEEAGGRYRQLAEVRGGTFLGRCDEQRVGPCEVVWLDDDVLIGIGVSGPVFDDLDVERLEGALDEALPSLVARLAQIEP